MTENKWPTKKSVTDAIDAIVAEYGCVGGAMVAVQVSYLAEQVQKDMQAIVSAQDARIAEQDFCFRHAIEQRDKADAICVAQAAEIERLTAALAEANALSADLRADLWNIGVTLFGDVAECFVVPSYEAEHGELIIPQALDAICAIVNNATGGRQ